MTVHIRKLMPAPTTVDIEARTVEAIVSTGADAPRPGYTERLDLAGADLSRMIGAPVLDAHNSASTRDQLGVIEEAELRQVGLWVRMKFRSNAAAQAVLGDIAEGTLRGLSIGYHVTEWTEQRDGKQLIRTATKWTPIEVSIVPVPADPGAHFRAGESTMTTQTQTTTPAPSNRAAVNAQIRQIATTAGLTREWADAQIDAEATPAAARRRAFDAMQKRGADTATRSTATIGTDNTDPAVFVTRAGEALFARFNPAHKLSDAARPYAGMSTVDIARESLRRSGVSVTSLSADTIVTRAMHTGSDFPLILGDAVGRELRRTYEAAPSGVREVARQSTARDFRAKWLLQLGEGPDLKRVGEGGEFKSGTIDESGESYSVETFGRILSISRQAVINDDLGAFSQIPAKLGIAAASFEASQLVAKLTANPAMSDGVAVFDASRGNLSAAGNPSLTTLTAARLAMRKRTGLGGELINATPRFVLVPAELETVTQQFLAEIEATTTADVNPFSMLTMIVDPRLPEDEWYVVADPATIDGLEYSYLEGAPGPQVETRNGFEVDGVQMKIRLDFGCGWVDYRGWHKVG